MWVLIFMIFFAICCGIVANNKNRSIIIGIINGALFGIFAFIIYLLLSKKEKN